MRKLKLQVQITIDGFVAGPEGQLDWMTQSQDEPKSLMDLVNELTDSSDIILMGRKMTKEFVTYWEDVVDNKPESPEFTFAGKMVDKPKIVFSKTVQSIEGRNVTVENGDLVTVVNELKMKSKPGKDLLVYGGAGFVRSLLSNNLIDELFLFVNPVAIGKGLQIFPDSTKLKLADSTAYKGGIVVNHYLSEK